MYNYSSVNLSCLIFKFNCHALIQVYNLENTTIALTLQIHLRIFMTKPITVVNTGLWGRSTTLDHVLNINTIRNFTHLWLSLTTKATLVSKHSLLDLGKKTKVIQIKDQISEIWVHSYCSIVRFPRSSALKNLCCFIKQNESIPNHCTATNKRWISFLHLLSFPMTMLLWVSLSFWQ